METLKKRYFMCGTKGMRGGSFVVNPGQEIFDKITNSKIIVGFKICNIDGNGIVETNDLETIYHILDAKNAVNFFHPITKQPYELFRGLYPKEDMEFSGFYKIDVKKHTEEIAQAIKDGKYKYTPPLNISQLQEINAQKRALLSIEKESLDNELLEEEVKEKKAKVAKMKKENKATE